MTTNSKKPGVAYWMTVVIVVVLMYPLSFGPACWITSRTGGNGVLPVIFRPIIAMIPVSDKTPLMPGIHGGRMFQYPKGIICGLATIGAAPGWAWRCSAEWERVGLTHDFKRTTDWQWEWCDSSKQ